MHQVRRDLDQGDFKIHLVNWLRYQVNGRFDLVIFFFDEVKSSAHLVNFYFDLGIYLFDLGKKRSAPRKFSSPSGKTL